ncbi:hypothetical protein cand_030830 [Cryptosporidium andersoni]|uniref:Uncharacterized protein n=1 Tax=Cryptosporidium andersoni TaxID=117008 RepID=A0A1J4MRZ1_9CRYT|nr:hypothetical protein cand_030830 [Cryptosporidium andersoni]
MSIGDRRTILTLGTVGLILGSIWYLTAEKRKNTKKSSVWTNEKVKDILKDVANNLHPLMMDLAHLASTIDKSTTEKGEPLKPEHIEALVTQGSFHNKILIAQKKVYESWDIDEDTLEELIRTMSKEDNEITLLNTGINQMYQDAIKGIMPILPYYGSQDSLSKIFPSLNGDGILDLLKKLNIEKEQRFKAVMDDIGDPLQHTINHPVAGILPSDHLAKQLQEANDQSEEAVLGTDVEFRRAFSHALALYSRDENFLKERQRIEQDHSNKIVNIIMDAKK